jgi:hypothetical protein
MQRLGIAMVQPREDLGCHSYRDPRCRAVAEIQTNGTVYVP